eukprot:gene12374-14617_t
MEFFAGMNESDFQLKGACTDCLAEVLHHTRGYIWQREPFSLEVHLAEPGDAVPSHLHGTVRFGDNIEDEWLIVSLLTMLTHKFPTLLARAWDGDGDFQLIEAAYALPAWVKPTRSANRVFLKRGRLHMLPREGVPRNPTLRQALALLGSNGVKSRVSTEVEAALAPRLKGYPQRALDELHQARCRLPASVAHVLRRRPQLVASAIHTFYERLPTDLKAAARMEHFPPEDFVT